MVYVDSGDLKWMPYVKSWLNNEMDVLQPHVKDVLESLFQIYVPNVFKMISDKCTVIISQV